MPGLTGNQLHGLLTALRHRFEARPESADDIGEEIRKVSAALDRRALSPQPVEPTSHPLTRHLPAALSLTAASAAAVAAALQPIAALLPWRYGYLPRPDAPGLDAAMGWAEIVGPEAPFRSAEVCFGLTLIGSDTFYRPHRHPARELYHVLAGNAAWTAAGSTATRAPGDYILHSEDMIHAMRTGREPLLAIYSWTGDVVSPSVWAEPAS
ncbi:MAG TPA: dimethylsulfonioproprionate lyase family protein [Rhodopseudomonas sp.]|uniref:dimethylsulfonioproprionate lyase family protein n=1 Tax=Rhodopseudomonas sp. TaxID=1078 RepID=UPI002EDA8EBF